MMGKYHYLHSWKLTWRAPKWWALEKVTGPFKPWQFLGINSLDFWGFFRIFFPSNHQMCLYKNPRWQLLGSLSFTSPSRWTNCAKELSWSFDASKKGRGVNMGWNKKMGEKNSTEMAGFWENRLHVLPKKSAEIWHKKWWVLMSS